MAVDGSRVIAGVSGSLRSLGALRAGVDEARETGCSAHCCARVGARGRRTRLPASPVPGLAEAMGAGGAGAADRSVRRGVRRRSRRRDRSRDGRARQGRPAAGGTRRSARRPADRRAAAGGTGCQQRARLGDPLLHGARALPGAGRAAARTDHRRCGHGRTAGGQRTSPRRSWRPLSRGAGRGDTTPGSDRHERTGDRASNGTCPTCPPIAARRTSSRCSPSRRDRTIRRLRLALHPDHGDARWSR